jgi:YVTN family beta-propeller protein
MLYVGNDVDRTVSVIAVAARAVVTTIALDAAPLALGAAGTWP